MTMCPLNQFIALTKDVIPTDWEKECAMEWEQLGYNMNTTAIIGKFLLQYKCIFYILK